LEAVILIIIGLILTLYLLIEREQTLDWVISFFHRDRRQKVRKTLGEARKVALNYVAGNMVTATFAGVFVFTSMSLLGVRAPLLLALLAAFCDFIPILGFLLSGLPAVLLGTASGVNVLVIIGLYVFYHVIESYVIFPKIYGDRLKLSNVAVVVAFAIGAELGGVIGAILALPIAATYPSIERIWLGRYLGDDVVEDHQRSDKSA
jgi:predicted PurR-regulated permease PerM